MDAYATEIPTTAPLRTLVVLCQVVFTDDMAVDPVGVIKDVLDFLGLDFTSEDESKVCYA